MVVRHLPLRCDAAHAQDRMPQCEITAVLVLRLRPMRNWKSGNSLAHPGAPALDFVTWESKPRAPTRTQPQLHPARRRSCPAAART
jgi:hypothetical protein